MYLIKEKIKVKSIEWDLIVMTDMSLLLGLFLPGVLQYLY